MANELSVDDFERVKEQFRNWRSDENPCTLNLLITGKTGTGKSRLVNALLGRNVAEEGCEKDPCTSKVTSYEKTFENVKITVWDSPGLQDGTTKESEYIQDMEKKVKDFAVMIYCVRMDETRFYEEDKKAIKILTDKIGKDIWEHAVVALTFANQVEDPDGEDESEYFEMQLRNWKKQFKDYFVDVGVNPELCIPVIPAGNSKKSMCLPDQEHWLSELWIECYQVMKASERLGMYRINIKRSRNTEIPFNDTQQQSFNTSNLRSFFASPYVRVLGHLAIGLGFFSLARRLPLP